MEDALIRVSKRARKVQPQHTRVEPPPTFDDRPQSVYELITRQMLGDLKEDVGEVKGRVNTLLWLVTGAMLLDVVMRVVGNG